MQKIERAQITHLPHKMILKDGISLHSTATAKIRGKKRLTSQRTQIENLLLTMQHENYLKKKIKNLGNSIQLTLS